MANPRDEKRALKNRIMAALESEKRVSEAKLIAELSLQTGFNEATIRKVLSQMESVGYIVKEGDTILPGGE